MTITATRSRRTGLIARRIILGAIIAFLVFEVGIRFIPADGMSYVAENASGQVIYTYSTSDQAVISSWQNALNTAPQSVGLLPDCGWSANPVYVYHTYTFTWHGIPVESAWVNQGGKLFDIAADGSECSVYILSSGGLPNIFTRSAPQQDPPVEPPNSH